MSSSECSFKKGGGGGGVEKEQRIRAQSGHVLAENTQEDMKGKIILFLSIHITAK